MSEKLPGPESKKDFLSEVKDRSLLLAWIAGFMIIGSLVWLLSRPLLTSYLMRSVNQSMAANGIAMHLSTAKSVPPPKQAPMGLWYSVDNSQNLFFVFTIFQDGILSVCGAGLTPENTVTEIIPLSAHARQVFSQISPGVIKLYKSRIENAAAKWRKNE